MMPLDDLQVHALTQHRSEAWRYDLLDLADKKIGELDGVSEGTFDFSVNNTIRSGGSLTTTGQDIDWLSVRIQPWRTVKAAGQTIEWPAGVFIPASPGVDYSAPGGIRNLELYDKLLVLTQDKIGATYGIPAGVNVTSTIRSLLQEAGEVRDAITDSPATLRTSMSFEAGTTKLQIINELLESINYFSLWVDTRGVFQGTPYVAPGGRGIAWTFADDHRSIYSPAFTIDEDTFNIPNRVSLVSTSDGETAALTAEARNEDPNSRYSFNRRGRWIDDTQQEVEASSQGVLNDLAQRRLIELSSATQTFNISHAPLPLELNDAVRFTRAAENISTTAVVQAFSISTAVGAPMKLTFRGVTL